MGDAADDLIEQGELNETMYLLHVQGRCLPELCPVCCGVWPEPPDPGKGGGE